ncbi:MAG TPA: tRNA (adenosine(37)-N6)-threonylcarbamoyltransferase complex dimerization subunit type 1 TsaB [Methylomirabilota bacterium]|nr:tRNA (adenosine(37)-N6)-threonylcarbamoyltransferase complex dimerization subunit type 1 TsaB [Methylomirabilota bacterium]
MRILALEFSTDRRSAAVIVDGAAAGEESVQGGRDTPALRLVEAALESAGVERELIEGVAVGLGPGSYTGIRASIALAEGWQLARGTRVTGVSSARAIAATARQEGLRGLTAVLIDAQRNEFYSAVYELEEAGVREVEAVRLSTAEEATGLAGRVPVVLSPDAWERFPGARCVFPRAAVVGELAAAGSQWVEGETLEPVYLRETTFVKAPAPRRF